MWRLQETLRAGVTDRGRQAKELCSSRSRWLRGAWSLDPAMVGQKGTSPDLGRFVSDEHPSRYKCGRAVCSAGEICSHTGAENNGTLLQLLLTS